MAAGPEDEEPLEGTLGRVLFRNEDSGFLIGLLEREQGLPVAIKGTLSGVRSGERIRLLGRWREDPRYGRQFQVSSFLPLRPETTEALERHLGSALVDGIGPVFARRLVAHFGDGLLDVLDHQPERLREVEGIGATRAQRIAGSWSEDRKRRDALLFLGGLGLPPGLASRIHARYREHTVQQLRDDPWRLAADVRGVGFPTADRVAMRLGVGADAPERLAAGVLHVLGEAAQGGHCGLPPEELRQRASTLLGQPEDAVRAAVNALVDRKEVVFDRGLHWRFESQDDEDATAERLLELARTQVAALELDVPAGMTWVQARSGLTLTPAQRQALALALVNKVVVITGGPGTGKTTLVRALLDLWERAGLRCRLAAPTGRAARRLEEASGRKAVTLHRLLEFAPRTSTFERRLGHPVAGDAFVVDEASMIDLQLMRALVEGLPDGARLVLVGDVEQLPSVGPGQILADIIDSGAVPVVRLDVVFRQAERSDIVRAAHGLLRGLPPRGAANPDGDFFVIARPDPEAAVRTILAVVAERIPSRWGLDPVVDVQVLSPMRKGAAGTDLLNQALRDRLNPGPAEVRFRAGDKVIQTRNNYDKDVFNGDVGVVLAGDGPGVTVRLDGGREVDWAKGELDELQLAWAITVHKSQGSEYPAVVVPILGAHRRMLDRSLLYTAMTRGKRVVVLVGDPQVAAEAAARGEARRRWTRLAGRLGKG